MSVLERVKHTFSMVAEGYANGCLIRGDGGLGKSYILGQVLREWGGKYVYYTGRVTPAGLWTILNENPTILIVLDDCEGLESARCVSYLKSSLWEADGRRRVNNVREDRVEFLDFEGRMIIVVNDWARIRNSNVKALLTRLHCIDVKLPNEQLKEMLTRKARDEWKLPSAVTEEAVKHILHMGDLGYQLDYRKIDLAGEKLLYCTDKGLDWREYLQDLFTLQEKPFHIKTMMESTRKAKTIIKQYQAYKRYCKEGGEQPYSRRQYDRIRHENNMTRQYAR